jgi:hypothetical protein
MTYTGRHREEDGGRGSDFHLAEGDCFAAHAMTRNMEISPEADVAISLCFKEIAPQVGMHPNIPL